MKSLRELEELLVPVADEELPQLLEHFQAELCAYLRAAASLLYTEDPLQQGFFQYEVGSGLAHAPTPSRFSKGEGFLGEAVKEKTILTERLPSQVLGNPGASALIEAPEVSVIAVPLIYQDRVEGLWCIASEQDLSATLSQEEWQDFLYRWAAYLQSIRTRRYIQALLEQTQIQNQELITREEELRQNLEELAVTQEEMKRAQQLLSKQSERQNFIIDLFTLMATARMSNFRSLSRIFLAQIHQYFRAEHTAAFVREEDGWRLLSQWIGKKAHLQLPPKWMPNASILEGLEKNRYPACYSDADLGFSTGDYYWLLMPYYIVSGLYGMILMAFPEPYPIETEGHKEFLQIPIAYFTAYDRYQEESKAALQTLELIARVSQARIQKEAVETPIENLPWLSEIPLVQREAYLSAFREALKQQSGLWIPPENISNKELIFFTEKAFYRLKWA
ncbi:MAG: hypothetical protein N2253_08100 [Bacteroidia bacterium]|nr:hypothetical protein [Bacteroidia bacterium]